jgi:hypothetical protein
MYLCILFSNTISMSDYVRVGFSAVPSSSICSFLYFVIITIFPFFIEMLQYDWLWSGHMIIKEMFYIQIKLKPKLARASMTTSDVNIQWRSNFQQQII